MVLDRSTDRSMVQAIKQVHYKVYNLCRVDETIISSILLQDDGWIVGNEDEEVHPLWFTGTF